MFDTYFHDPIYNLMVFLSNYLVDFGSVIILATIIIKFIIYPLYSGQIKNTIASKKAQPELKEIQKKLKDKTLDQFKRQELMLQMMKVNKKHGVKIFTPILSIAVQLTITLALYWIIYKGGFPKVDTSILYDFVKSTKEISMTFLGYFDLTKSSYIIAILAALTQFIHMEISMPDVKLSNLKTEKKPQKEGVKEDMLTSFQVYIKYGMPIMVLLMLAFTFNAALGLYWLTSNIFLIFQEKSVRGSKEEIKKITENEKNK